MIHSRSILRYWSNNAGCDAQPSVFSSDSNNSYWSILVGCDAQHAPFRNIPLLIFIPFVIIYLSILYLGSYHIS